MSVYRTFMAATQAVNTLNLRKTALATDALLDRAQAEDARRAHVEGLRQTLFEGAKVVRAADEAHAADAPAAAYYLALRTKPLFGPDGIADSDFPDLSDKAFHHTTMTTLRHVESGARQQLSLETAADVERLTWLERVEPIAWRLAVWRDVAALVAPFTATFHGGQKGRVRNVARAAVAFVLLFFVFGIPVEIFFGKTGVGIWFLIVAAWSAFDVVTGWKAPGLVRRARALLAEIGEEFPPGLTDAQAAENVRVLTATIDADGGGELSGQPNLRLAAAVLAQQRETIWNRLFAGIGAHPSDVDGLRLPS